MIATPKKKNAVISISPNAVKGSFRVHYPMKEFRGSPRASLMGSDGSLLDVPIEIQLTTTGEIDVMISNPASGIFYLSIMDGRTSVVKKIIVQ